MNTISHNRLSAFGVIGTLGIRDMLTDTICHNRLSAFGVIGTAQTTATVKRTEKESQSPFGFWGDWNPGM